MNRKAHALIAAALSLSGLMASSSASAQGFITSVAQSAGLISAEQGKVWDRTWHQAKENIPGAAAIDQTLTQSGRAAGNAALMSSGGLPAVIAGNLVADQWGRQVRREREVSHPTPNHHVPHHGSYSGHHQPAPMLGSLCRTGMYYSFIAPQAVGNSCWNHAWNMAGFVSNW